MSPKHIEELSPHFLIQIMENLWSLEAKTTWWSFGMLISIWTQHVLKQVLFTFNPLLDILIQLEKWFLIQITINNAFQLEVKMEFTFGNSLEMLQSKKLKKQKFNLLWRKNLKSLKLIKMMITMNLKSNWLKKWMKILSQ